jgi:molybdate transport system substrate-binding protein
MWKPSGVIGSRRRWRRCVVALAVLAATAGCGGAGSGASARESITVAAASDLRFAFEEIGDRFSGETGIEVVFSFGSSGLLREQIVNGAPFDVFASANTEFVDAVVEAGRGRADTRADYAIGRIVLVAPPGRVVPSSVDALRDESFRRIAIANPEHAPYGVAARQALDSAGVLDEVGDRLVFGENISDTLRIVRSGNADVGLVALALVVADDTPHVLVPPELHEPLLQALVVTAPDDRLDAATRFVDHVTSTDGRAVMARYGFELPERSG